MANNCSSHPTVPSVAVALLPNAGGWSPATVAVATTAATLSFGDNERWRWRRRTRPTVITDVWRRCRFGWVEEMSSELELCLALVFVVWPLHTCMSIIFSFITYRRQNAETFTLKKRKFSRAKVPVTSRGLAQYGCNRSANLNKNRRQVLIT